MKKSILLVAIAAVTLASCNKESSTNNGDSLTPISLTGSAASIDATRAVVNTGDAFTAQIVASANTANYATTLFSQATTFAATTGATTLSPAQYYTAGGTSTFIKGYAPTSGALASGTVTFTTDGTQDIMVSNEVSGTTSNAATKAMTFSHLLTQLQFKVVAADAAAAAAWGNVTKIEVIAQPSVFTLALSGSTLSAGTAPILFTSLAAGSVVLPELPATAASAGVPMMIQPVAAAGTVQLKVYTTLNTAGITVTATAPAGGFAASTAHEITLTFKAVEITVSGSVGNWIDGEDQNINLQ